MCGPGALAILAREGDEANATRDTARGQPHHRGKRGVGELEVGELLDPHTGPHRGSHDLHHIDSLLADDVRP